MLSLLIGVGTLLLAVVISALIDPWPRPPREDAIAEPGGQQPVTQLTYFAVLPEYDPAP